MSQEEFVARYETYLKEIESGDSKADLKKSTILESKMQDDNISESIKNNREGNFKSIVLKFTTLSEGTNETPSFTVGPKGASIGREQSNEICVPNDQRLAPEGHSRIEFHRGAFYIIDGGFNYSASIRIGVSNGHHKKWFVDKNVRFSAGNSIFCCNGINEEGYLDIVALEGPLKGEKIVVKKSGATFGRSSENTICVPDRELSRKHSRIDYDEKCKRYILNDMGSTNGTYIQLVGPYGGKYKLNLNDHILVGRTGFSINRFDYGLSEEMGYRQSMEDACTIVQHLNIGPLCVPELSPQSFFGVFDGHGGVEASHYIAQNLHVNIAHGLLDIANDVFQILDDTVPHNLFDDRSKPQLERLDKLISESLKSAFLKTDNDFLTNSECPQHGSTATTALVLGRRLYCGNVGDSRTILCRFYYFFICILSIV